MPDGPDFPPATKTNADAGFMTLPNAITLARLCAVPLAVWLVLRGDLATAFWLFVGAGVSDGFDGWIARRWKTRSLVGAILDPIADKALLVSMFVTLAIMHVLPDWLAILVVFRDVLIVGGVLLLYVMGQMVLIKPILISKLNTVLQIALAALALLFNGYGLVGHWAYAALTLDIMVWLVTVTTLASGVAYVWSVAKPPPA